MANDDLGCLGLLFKMAFPIAAVFFFAMVADCSSTSQGSMIKEARKENSMKHYSAYIAKHPTGKYVGEAKDAILKIAKTSSLSYIAVMDAIVDKEYDTDFTVELSSIRDSIVNVAYNEAKKTGSWAFYMYQLPEKHWRDAEKQQETYEKKAWGSEASAWKTAVSRNNQHAYTQYLELYPNGKHSKQAVEWLVDNVYSGSYGNLPSMEKVGYSQSSRSTIKVSNGTGYKLTVLYSGKDSKGLVIQPGGSASVNLPNGSYRVAASVTASNVRSFAGSEHLTGGNYEVSYYIETRRY